MQHTWIGLCRLYSVDTMEITVGDKNGLNIDEQQSVGLHRERPERSQFFRTNPVLNAAGNGRLLN